LRLQRMLTDRPMPVAAPTGVTGAIATVATLVAPDADADAGHERATLRRRRATRNVPTLPRESTVDGTPIRRVTLPRAMSAVHRPWATALDERAGVLATVATTGIGDDRVQAVLDRDNPTAARHEHASRRAPGALAGADLPASSPGLERRPPAESHTPASARPGDGDVTAAEPTGRASVAPPVALTPDGTGSNRATVHAGTHPGATDSGSIDAGSTDSMSSVRSTDGGTDIGSTDSMSVARSTGTVPPGGSADTILRRHQATAATAPLSGRVST